MPTRIFGLGFLLAALMFLLACFHKPSDELIWLTIANFGLASLMGLADVWILRRRQPSRSWLRKMADGEDAAGSVSVGGMAVDCEQPVRNREQLISDLGRARMASEMPASEMVAMDLCPKCGGELDMGWECNSCGFDAMPLVRPQ